MTLAVPTSVPTLQELLEGTASDWTIEEMQAAAKSALHAHAPDREPVTWTRHWGLVSVPHRHHATCVHCGDVYPCITYRYAAQLLSGSRVAALYAVPVD